jgi:preprotein translocase YajC subunit
MHRLLILLIPVLLAATEGPGGVPTQTPALDGPVTPGGRPPGADMSTMLMFLVIPAMLIFMMWSSSRAQKRERKQREEMLDALKVGDAVVTSSGAHATIVRKGEGTIDLRLGEGAGLIVTHELSAVARPVGSK